MLPRAERAELVCGCEHQAGHSKCLHGLEVLSNGFAPLVAARLGPTVTSPFIPLLLQSQSKTDADHRQMAYLALPARAAVAQQSPCGMAY